MGLSISKILLSVVLSTPTGITLAVFNKRTLLVYTRLHHGWVSYESRGSLLLFFRYWAQMLTRSFSWYSIPYTRPSRRNTLSSLLTTLKVWSMFSLEVPSPSLSRESTLSSTTISSIQETSLHSKLQSSIITQTHQQDQSIVSER